MEPKEGDIFISNSDGETFVIQKIVNDMVVLKSKYGKREILTGVSNLDLFYRREVPKRNKGVEERKYPRYLVKGDLIAILHNGKEKVGKVKDIGMGGLSFDRIQPVDEKRSNQRSSKSSLFLRMGDEFSLSQIPYRLVYDTPVQLIQSSEYMKFPLNSTTRRCGVQFQALSDDQKRQLELFLKTHTTGISP